MSELSDGLALDHKATVGFNEGLRCVCDGHQALYSVSGYARHIATVTEAAVRETIADAIELLPSNRTLAWSGGFDSISQDAAVDIARVSQ